MVKTPLLKMERSDWSLGGTEVEWVNVESVLTHECQHMCVCVCMRQGQLVYG